MYFIGSNNISNVDVDLLLLLFWLLGLGSKMAAWRQSVTPQ